MTNHQPCLIGVTDAFHYYRHLCDCLLSSPSYSTWLGRVLGTAEKYIHQNIKSKEEAILGSVGINFLLLIFLALLFG
jgi:hypothetical protein